MMRTSGATLLVLLSVCSSFQFIAEATSTVCQEEGIHAPYLKWVSGVRDAALRAKACAAAKALDSHTPQDVLDAADFFHAVKAQDVLVEALQRAQRDYAKWHLLAHVVDLAKPGDLGVVKLVRDEFARVEIRISFGGMDAQSSRDDFRKALVQALAKFTSIDFSGVDISTEEGKAEVIELVEDWLNTR